MTDDHLRILETLARRSQRRLDQHDAVDAAPAAGSASRRRELQARVKRTNARVAAARARRRQDSGASS
jgi:hypothetical protein